MHLVQVIMVTTPSYFPLMLRIPYRVVIRILPVQGLGEYQRWRINVGSAFEDLSEKAEFSAAAESFQEIPTQ